MEAYIEAEARTYAPAEEARAMLPQAPVVEAEEIYVYDGWGMVPLELTPA